jgi:integrase
VLTEAELVRVYRAAEEYPFGTIVRLLILTGQRRSEISNLRWEYINDSDRTISLPASLTKNNRQHTFPYGKLAQQLLKTIPHVSEYLLPARGNKEVAFSGWSKCKAAFDKKCKIAPWTLHDLRRTYSTVHAAIGTPPHITERFKPRVWHDFRRGRDLQPLRLHGRDARRRHGFRVASKFAIINRPLAGCRC